MKTLRKLLSRLFERLQKSLRKYEYPIVDHGVLTDEDCELLQFMVEHPCWEVALRVRDNMNYKRNAAAIGFCDGRSLVQFKLMEGTNEYLEVIESIVDIHKKKAEPVAQPEEKPRKIAEYVP